MQFQSNILPGNYWLTKSMEFVKKQSSGTLWYLKKWITYYNYIFFKDYLYDEDYLEISQIFKDFIYSLDKKIQNDAWDFFFNVDINSQNFTKFNKFAQTNLSSRDRYKEFILNAKKFYFIYVMGIGGQSGYKKFIKDKITEGNSFKETLKLLKNKIDNKNITAESKKKKYTEMINDFHAALRNERQIFFYYGFFHGKESSDLSGFYQLTNIGKTILKSNFHELLLLWEHQKLKMVSQSPIADIQNLNKIKNIDYKKFNILPHPYFTLLHILNKKQEITSKQYQFVISKINEETDINYVIQNVLGVNETEKYCERIAYSFNRKSEVETEDFLKEIKKFILGICKLPKDKNCNYFQFTSWITENSPLIITNKKKANYILRNYKKITDYLDRKYSELYSIFNKSLKEKYIKLIEQESYISDDSTKYEWYKHIINFDVNLYLTLIYISIALKYDCYDYFISENILFKHYDTFENVLKLFGIKKSYFKKLIPEIQIQLRQNNIFEIEGLKVDHVEPRIFTKTITEKYLLEISNNTVKNNNIYTTISRERNQVLINYLRTFYINNFSDPNTNLIDCDCCTDKTFLTKNNYAYLEFHHLIPFSTDFGPDHYLNMFGICPLCHRKLHYLKTEENKPLYEAMSQNNNLRKTIIERINYLFKNNMIEPINLDFLKKEKIITYEQYNKYINNIPANTVSTND